MNFSNKSVETPFKNVGLINLFEERLSVERIVLQ